MIEIIRLSDMNGHIDHDVPLLLRRHNCPRTAVHCGDVAAEARQLAIRFGADPQQATIAGWLHDVSAVIPNAQRIEAARNYGIDVLPEEAAFPMIIHQKLSAALARDIFDIDDEAILSAVGCHTTLKRDASVLDQVIFVADKIAWDQPGTPPYREELVAALDTSLDRAAFVYLEYLWDMRDQLRVVHPWMEDAYRQLAKTL